MIRSIHTLGGSKLDERAKIGRWISFNEISNGHRIYWPNKCSVSVEWSIQIVNDNVVLLSKPIAKLTQGESGPENPWHDPETELGPTQHKNNHDNFETNQENNIKNPDDPNNLSSTNQTEKTDKHQNHQQTVSQNINEPEILNIQSCRTRIPTQYIKDI